MSRTPTRGRRREQGHQGNQGPSSTWSTSSWWTLLLLLAAACCGPAAAAALLLLLLLLLRLRLLCELPQDNNAWGRAQASLIWGRAQIYCARQFGGDPEIVLANAVRTANADVVKWAKAGRQTREILSGCGGEPAGPDHSLHGVPASRLCGGDPA